MSGTGDTESPLFGSLQELRDFIGDCERCALARTRTNLVFGVGDPRARLMFIGEAPGRNEDLQGEPFVGAAGKLLDELLASIGLARSQVYIANVLKCRPPGNRDPLAEEMERCTPFLEEQVRLIDPEVIATLGNFATRHVLKTQTGITRLRGRLFRVDGRKVVPIYHPAAALYDRTKQDVLFADFQRLKAVLDSFDETGRAARGTDESGKRGPSAGAGEGGVEQPALF
jgi:DNA polymerase